MTLTQASEQTKKRREKAEMRRENLSNSGKCQSNEVKTKLLSIVSRRGKKEKKRTPPSKDFLFRLFRMSWCRR